MERYVIASYTISVPLLLFINIKRTCLYLFYPHRDLPFP